MEEEELVKPPKKPKKEFLEPLELEERDAFYSKVSMDANLAISDPRAHMLFISDCEPKPRITNRTDMMPMYYRGKRQVSAHRVAYFLNTGVDPQKKRYITQLCGHWNCINPFHMLYEPPETPERELFRGF